MARVVLLAAWAGLLGACASGGGPAPETKAIPSVQPTAGEVSPAASGPRVVFVQSGATATSLLEGGAYQFDVPLSPSGGKKLAYFCARAAARESAAVKDVSLYYGTIAPGVPVKGLRPVTRGLRRTQDSVCADEMDAEPLIVRVLIDRLAPVDLFVDSPFQRQELLPLHRGTPSRPQPAP